MVVAAVSLAWAASRDAAPANTAPVARPSTAIAPAPTPKVEGRWLPGDMHNHISPPDVPPNYDHAKSNLEGAIAAAKKAGLAWLVITPHAMDRKDAKTGRLWFEEMTRRLAQREATPDDPLVVLGWERTYRWPGDMTVSFCDVTRLVGKAMPETLAEIASQGGLAFAAHPFFLPNIIVRSDKSWKPWTGKDGKGRQFDVHLTGLEIRHPMSPAAMATRHWDKWIARQKRRIVGVGATDDHWGVLYATTWVYIEGDLSREKLHAALAGGRVVAGGRPDASTLTVTSDRKSPDGAPVVGRIGDAIEADRTITLAWKGKARVFIDGRRLEQRTGPATFSFDPGTFHWVRLEVGVKSYGNPVYINLPPRAKPKPIKPEADQPKEERDTDAETNRPKFGGSK
jgi:hypothetical protein